MATRSNSTSAVHWAARRVARSFVDRESITRISGHKESHGVLPWLTVWVQGGNDGLAVYRLESIRARFERRSARSLARRFVSLGFS